MRAEEADLEEKNMKENFQDKIEEAQKSVPIHNEVEKDDTQEIDNEEKIIKTNDSKIDSKPKSRQKSPAFSMPAVFDTPEAKIAAFLALLEECKITSTSSWESALKQIKRHEHFNVLS